MSTTSNSFAEDNRGPLTTIYTPPATCLAITTGLFQTSSDGGGDYVYFQNHYIVGDTACYPPTIDSPHGTEYWGNYYYSPGISCPYGWYIATTQEVSFAGVSTTLSSASTGALCCPRLVFYQTQFMSSILIYCSKAIGMHMVELTQNGSPMAVQRLLALA